MDKIKAYFGLKIISVGICIYDNNTDMHWDAEDKQTVERLWKWHDHFTAILNG